VIAREISALNVAMEMIKEGLRPPIVHAATGLCRNRIRELFRSIHGRPAPQGRVSEHAFSRLKTRGQIIEGTTFYQVYHRQCGDRIFQILDPKLFIEAYRVYKAVSRCLDVTTAWYIARDLKENTLTPRKCKNCGRTYLYDHRSDRMIRCPLCDG
jgi:predicted Zn-ribbon and HTH transcriptional regulator